jgi:tellurite resistance protein TehA-like permease
VAQDRCAVLTSVRRTGLRARVADGVRTLNPGYFALVMATGIMSVAMENNGPRALAVALLAVAIAAYAVLLVLTA